MRITVWRSHFQSDPTAVGDGAQRVHRVQLASGFVRIVHAVDAQAQLEAQLRVVAKPAGDLRQQFASYMQRQLVAVDDDFLDGVGEFDVIVGFQRLGQPVDQLVEVSAVRTRTSFVDRDLANQSSVARSVTAAPDAEHAVTNADQVGVGGVGTNGCSADLAGCALGIVPR